MKWTQRHAKNAVAARARRRMLEPELEEPFRRVARPRSKSKWRIQIRDEEHGDTLTTRLYRLPWPARYVGCDGKEYSAAGIGKVVATILREAA